MGELIDKASLTHICTSEVNILSFTTTMLALGLYLHSEVQICVSDALSISSSFQSLVGCRYVFLCVALSLVSLLFFLYDSLQNVFHYTLFFIQSSLSFYFTLCKTFCRESYRKKRRLTKDKATHKKTYRQPTKDWKEELIDKASLTHICTSECRYRPKASMVVEGR